MDNSLLLTVSTTMTDKDCWLRFMCVFFFLSRAMRAFFFLCLFSYASHVHFSLKMPSANFVYRSSFHGIALVLIDRYLLVSINSALVYDEWYRARWNVSQSLGARSGTYLHVPAAHWHVHATNKRKLSRFNRLRNLNTAENILLYALEWRHFDDVPL